MSGGAFNYNDYHITGIADQIEEFIRDNEDRSEYRYSEATIQRFREAVKLLREAGVYVHRIDWLVSGDDGEDTFHKRLERDLAAK
jgi:hypothetical protein